MDSRPSFFADDAFTYVESYKDLVVKNIQQITQLKEEFESKFWDGTNSDPFYYVKLRSFEHAIKYKETGKEPKGLVVIGDTPSAQENFISPDEEKMKELEKKANQFSDAVKNMQSELKKAQARETSLKGEIIQREQAIKRLQRQMTNTQGTYAVLISTLIIGVALAFWL